MEGVHEPVRPAKSRLSDVSGTLRDSRRALIVVAVLAVGAGLLEAFQLFLVSQLALSVAKSGNTVDVVGGPLDWHPTVPQALIVALVTAVAWMLFGIAAGFFQARATTKTLVGIQTRLTSSFLAASHDIQAAERQGNLQELISKGPEVALMVMHVSMGLFGLLNAVILVAVAVVINPLASLMLIVGMGALIGLLMPLSRRTRALSSSRVDYTMDLAEGISETVSTAREVQLFDVTGPVTTRLEGQIAAASRPYFMIKFFIRFVPVLYQGASIMLVVGGLAAIYRFGGSDASQLSGLILLLVRATTFGSMVQGAVQALSDVVPINARIDRQEAAYRKAVLRPGHEHVDSIDKLQLEDVNFGYDPENLVLRDVSLSIHRGESVAIIGATGAGKSTLVQLLLRLRQPMSGSYRVNGIDASSLDAGCWAHLVALAPQDGRLVRGTVAENIVFFRAGLSPDDVQRAAEAVHLQPDLSRWPDGIQTQVGSRGEAISGGQVQRINLARALAGKPDLLVLDEPTSAVDSETERAIVDTLRTMKGRITIIVIAHRQSTISMCDRVLEVREGVVLDRPASRV